MKNFDLFHKYTTIPILKIQLMSSYQQQFLRSDAFLSTLFYRIKGQPPGIGFQSLCNVYFVYRFSSNIENNI
jgi:hypothetical protein